MSSDRDNVRFALALLRVCLTGLLSTVSAGAAPVSVTSPDGKVAIVIDVGGEGHLIWRATMDGKPVIEPSPLGIIVDRVDLGSGVEIQKTDRYRVDEKYPWNPDPTVDEVIRNFFIRQPLVWMSS